MQLSHLCSYSSMTTKCYLRNHTRVYILKWILDLLPCEKVCMTTTIRFDVNQLMAALRDKQGQTPWSLLGVTQDTIKTRMLQKCVSRTAGHLLQHANSIRLCDREHFHTCGATGGRSAWQEAVKGCGRNGGERQEA